VDDAPYIGDLDLGAVHTRDDLAGVLRTVHVRADRPSLRQLEAKTRHTASPLSKTVVAEMLRGTRFPRKAVMVAFLRACGVADDDLERWRQTWDRVAAREGQVAVGTARPASAPAEQEPIGPDELRVFGAELTKTLHARRRTIEQTAAELGLSLAEVAGWVSGEEIPSEPQARLLDEYLMARGAILHFIIELRAKAARTGPRLRALLPDPSPPALLHTFANVAKALRGCVARDADGKPTGWRRDLRDLLGEPQGVATAYGLRTMVLLEDGLAPDLVPVADSLMNMALPGGGYASDEQAGDERAGSRLEATAEVVGALRQVAALGHFDTHISRMEKDLGDFEKYRPFILTLALETSLLLRPEAKFVDLLIDCLLATRRLYGDFLLWPERAEPLLIAPAPSVVHTARAVRALARVQAIRPVGQVQEALEEAVAWLVEQRDLHNAYEITERPVNRRFELVYVRHFTAAWMVKALVAAGVPAAHPTVRNAVDQIWSSFGGDATALWAWENGDLPIWMTFDAVEALRLAQLAARSGGPTSDRIDS
jgi:hypothetical protein